MTHEEDDSLDEELRRLDVREDYYDEDSDETPVNSPPTSWKYPSNTNSLAYEPQPIIQRYNCNDDFDIRSESSLSWGEDEFEVEATRMVTGLFNQLDDVLYSDRINSLSKQKIEIQSFDGGLSVTKKNLDNLSPSAELKEECADWLTHFPHFRIRGYAVQPIESERISGTIFENDPPTSNLIEDEEIIAQNGNYDELLSYVSLSEKVCHGDAKRKNNSNSMTRRVCSGSTDPEVLREQLLIVLFDKLWSKVTDILSPLLHQYAKYIIEQSAELSSIGRESSSRGCRSSALHSRNDLFVRKNIEESSAYIGDGFLRPYSSNVSNRGFTKGKTTVGMLSRPTSAVQKLPPTNSTAAQRLHELLLITSKPLQQNEEKIQLSVSSALRRRRYSFQSGVSSSSIVSLPAVNTNSLGGSLINTPRTLPTTISGLTSSPSLNRGNNSNESRPSSTNSYNRRKFQNKFQQLSVNEHAIHEGLDSSAENTSPRSRDHFEDEDVEHLGGNSWSKNVPFLPPINQFSPGVQTTNKLYWGSSAPNQEAANLRIRGTTLSAQQRPLKNLHSQPSVMRQPRGLASSSTTGSCSTTKESLKKMRIKSNNEDKL